MKKRVKIFVGDFFRGLGSPVEVFSVHQFKLYSCGQVQDMRSDWERIGNDFRAVVKRENVKTAPEASKPSA